MRRAAWHAKGPGLSPKTLTGCQAAMRRQPPAGLPQPLLLAKRLLASLLPGPAPCHPARHLTLHLQISAWLGGTSVPVR